MKFAALAAIPLALAACSDISPQTTKPVQLTEAQMKTLQESVAYDLYDPSSAQFRNIQVADNTYPDGHTVRGVCGEINGKNRLGGYVGFTGFTGKIDASGRYVVTAMAPPCR
jgi:hypothetical protein